MSHGDSYLSKKNGVILRRKWGLRNIMGVLREEEEEFRECFRELLGVI